MALGDSTYIPLDPKLFNDNNELSNMKSYILRQLGWPLIRVEITEDQLVDCILDAVQCYHEYVANDYALKIVEGFVGNIIDIPEDINPKFIVDILFEKNYFDMMLEGLSVGNPEDILGGIMPMDIMTSEVASNEFDIAQYYMYLQYVEDFKRVAGIKFGFQILKNQIHVYPSSKQFTRIGILYKPMITEREAEQSIWIKKYAVAKAKLIVGTIRSKLSGFSSTGANISADGEAMKSEAREDIAALEEKLQNLGIPMPFIQM